MLENMPDTGYSNIDRSVLYKRGMAQMLLASADEEREMSVEIQRLRKDLLDANKIIAQQEEQIKQLKAQISLLQSVPSQTNHIHVGGDFINNQYNANNHE